MPDGETGGDVGGAMGDISSDARLVRAYRLGLEVVYLLAS